jgi:branched-subunit amino acid transport protein
MSLNIAIYILVSFMTSYLIRVLPLTLIRKPITNPFVCSFLYYVPYVTLAVMTFPAMIQSTQSMIAGICAMIVGIVLAWHEKGLPIVASACCITVLILEHFICV